jgi:hypothetical protein
MKQGVTYYAIQVYDKIHERWVFEKAHSQYPESEREVAKRKMLKYRFGIPQDRFRLVKFTIEICED